MSVTATQTLTQHTVTVTGTPVENNVTVTVSNARGVAGTGGGGSTVTVSDTAPTSPSDGDQWLDSTTGTTWTWYVDDGGGQWINEGVAITQGAMEAAITDANALRDVLGADIGYPVSNDVLTLLNAHATANAGCTAWALRQWAWCLTELEAGGILDELRDGICLRTGYNTASAMWSIRNVAATIAGTQRITPDGALFPGGGGTATVYVTLPVADSRVHTIVTDFRYSPDAPSDSGVLCLTASNGVNGAASLLMNSASLSDAGTIYTANGGSAAFTSAFGNTESAFAVRRYNPNDTIAAWSNDNASSPTITGYVNGLLVLTDSSGNYQATSDLVVLCVGARKTASSYDLPMDGTVASVLLFSRVLTAAEHLVAAKAARHLDPRKMNLVTYGDSRTTHVSDSTRVTGNWPYQYAANPQIARTMRLMNIANNGWTTATMASSFAARGAHLGPNGTSILETRFYLWTGANDWLANVSGATAWASALSVLRAARAAGMRVTVCTDPEAGSTYTAPQEAARVAFNALVLAAFQEADSIWDLDTIVGTAHDAALWLDEIHLDSEGNRTLAANLASGGFARITEFT